jgi:hypothetical protein
MNWNPYKRPDYKNMTDAELDATVKSLDRKQKIALAVNVLALGWACVALGGIFWPAIFPAIPAFVSNFMVAGALFSQTRFSTLRRECNSEKLDRELAQLSNTFQSTMKSLAEDAAPKPASEPVKPSFNHTAATVLDEDIEVSKPLTFKKKAPGATA